MILLWHTNNVRIVGKFVIIINDFKGTLIQCMYIVGKYLICLYIYIYIYIFGKQTGYIFQSPETIKKWATKHYASLNQWYNTE